MTLLDTLFMIKETEMMTRFLDVLYVFLFSSKSFRMTGGFERTAWMEVPDKKFHCWNFVSKSTVNLFEMEISCSTQHSTFTF